VILINQETGSDPPLVVLKNHRTSFDTLTRALKNPNNQVKEPTLNHSFMAGFFHENCQFFDSVNIQRTGREDINKI
jgi:hypothetical protein